MAPIVPLGAGFRLPPLMSESADLRALFHRLNNQLGTILAHAELLESKASSDLERLRAAQIVTSALEAMTTVRSHPRTSDRRPSRKLVERSVTPCRFACHRRQTARSLRFSLRSRLQIRQLRTKS